MEHQPIEDRQTLNRLSNNCLLAIHEFAERQNWWYLKSEVEEFIA